MSAIHSTRLGTATPLEMTGPAVYAALSDEERRHFDREFHDALNVASATYDVEPLSEVVRRWWIASGGDPAVARLDRDAVAGHTDHAQCVSQDEPCCGHTAFAFGNQATAVIVRFEEAFRNAAEEAAVTLDHLPLRYLAFGYRADVGAVRGA
ncbi:DUF6247 family protein [Yinghuangia sp. YIM S09857]|uniref:DUF6247 family protein n=1 Tax=Yinghuangia sp. YIM S09857 TaxID=3436929 RepID=UPI003F529E67